MSAAHAGEKSSSAKLTWNEVNQIRELRTNGVAAKELANQFMVHIGTIYKICNNKKWTI